MEREEGVLVREGLGGGDWVLTASASPSPPVYPVACWSVPGRGSSHSSGQAGASGCSASAGCRWWMGGARRAHDEGSWRAGGPPGGGRRGAEPGFLCPSGPPPPRALGVALHLTRVQLAPPGCGWWRSSHFWSMYRVGFHDSQCNCRQPGWSGATSGLGSRAHRVGGSSFTAGRGVVRSFPSPIG